MSRRMAKNKKKMCKLYIDDLQNRKVDFLVSVISPKMTMHNTVSSRDWLRTPNKKVTRQMRKVTLLIIALKTIQFKNPKIN